jgi:3-dehydroquinate dehydratase/shikimate dehydrogenase
MLCVTIARTRHKHMMLEHQEVAAQGAQLVELRLDYIGRSVDLARLLKNRPTQVLVTCRRKIDGGRWERSEEERLMLLRQAIALGIEYVDLEDDIATKIPRYGKTKRIVSVHNFEGTPDHLESIHESLSKLDADIVKLAVTAHSFHDASRMLTLMRKASVPTIGISMGEYGSLTRILATRYGAPFTFCVYNVDRRVAPGQLSFHDMKNVYRVQRLGCLAWLPIRWRTPSVRFSTTRPLNRITSTIVTSLSAWLRQISNLSFNGASKRRSAA